MRKSRRKKRHGLNKPKAMYRITYIEDTRKSRAGVEYKFYRKVLILID